MDARMPRAAGDDDCCWVGRLTLGAVLVCYRGGPPLRRQDPGPVSTSSYFLRLARCFGPVTSKILLRRCAPDDWNFLPAAGT
jgi:hypothetical protein